MLNIIETNNPITYAIGDIHGEFKAISNWIKDHKLHDCNLIFCGDFGFGFDTLERTKENLQRAEKTCEENNVNCFILRGNHDDPDYYNTSLYNLNLSRFKPLSDYSVIKCPEHNILCLGGAVSTDRAYRKNAYEYDITMEMLRSGCSHEQAEKKCKLYWWEKEPFIYDESILEEIINSDLKIDAICSHSAPRECYPNTSDRVIYWCNRDKELEQDISKERNDLSKLLSFLKTKNQPVKDWYYGHYHEHHFETIDGVTFHLLDMGRNGRMNGNIGGFFDMAQLSYSNNQ